MLFSKGQSRFPKPFKSCGTVTNLMKGSNFIIQELVIMHPSQNNIWEKLKETYVLSILSMIPNTL